MKGRVDIKRMLVALSLVLVFSALFSHPVGLMYRDIFNLSSGDILDFPAFEGFFVSIPLWLGLLSIVISRDRYSYLSFVVSVSAIYILLTSGGSMEVLLGWTLPLFLMTFTAGTLLGLIAKFLYKKFKG